jgi:hypothetical protein
MIVWKNTNFENNPGGGHPNMMWEGRVRLKSGLDVPVYGFNQAEVVEVAQQFKSIEPNATDVDIFGPTDFWCNNRIWVENVPI